MPNVPALPAWAGAPGSDLLTRARSVLESELARIPLQGLARPWIAVPAEAPAPELPAQAQVPLVHAAAAVRAGATAVATIEVANEESADVKVTLYGTDFIADSGYHLPAHRMTVTPRIATLAGKSSANFEIQVAIPEQTPAGTYSALIQAMGSRYVKAVLSLDVS